MLLRNDIQIPHKFLDFISSEDALFHYTKKDIVFENILYQDSFKLSNFKNTNDPQEYKDNLIGASGWGWEDSTEKQIHQTLKLIDRIIKKQTGFASFCTNNFKHGRLQSNGCLQSRMWSQYGEGHEGICLVFSKQKIIEAITEFADDKELIFFEKEITYTDYIKDKSNHQTLFVNGDSFIEKSPQTLAANYVRNCHGELFFTKQNDYRDENEYRLIVCKLNGEGNENFDHQFTVSKCLKGLILGDRFHKTYLPLIESFTKKFAIEYRQLHWESGEYFLL
jgi:hypothetical protein